MGVEMCLERTMASGDLGLLSLAAFVADELSAVGSAHPRPKPELTQPLSLRNPMWVMCCHDSPLPLRYDTPSDSASCECYRASTVLTRKKRGDIESSSAAAVRSAEGVVLYRGVRRGMLSGK